MRNFYLSTIIGLFAVALMTQIPQFGVDDKLKMAILLGWGLYGIVPTVHWAYSMGGFNNLMVQVNVAFIQISLFSFCVMPIIFFLILNLIDIVSSYND